MRRKEFTDILAQVKMESMMIFSGRLGSSKSRTEEQVIKAKREMEVFMAERKVDEVMLFTDGSVQGSTNGKGGCGCVLVLDGKEEMAASEFVGSFKDNVATEVSSIVLALKMMVKFSKEKQIKKGFFKMM